MVNLYTGGSLRSYYHMEILLIQVEEIEHNKPKMLNY